MTVIEKTRSNVQNASLYNNKPPIVLMNYSYSTILIFVLKYAQKSVLSICFSKLNMWHTTCDTLSWWYV